MSVPSVLRRHFGHLNQRQWDAVSQTEGPLLVIAGPGSGKTLTLIVRTLNLLLQGLAAPGEILLSTFTEKAAFELRDRLSLGAKQVGYAGDLSDLLVGTIHGLCNGFLLRYRHRTPLGNNYETLDSLTQLLFIFDHFDEIIGEETDGRYLTRWATRWTAIQQAVRYFNKITEELIEPQRLADDPDPFLHAIGVAHQAYVNALLAANCIDFAHQQKLFLDLLSDDETAPLITGRVRYAMVDEYQDTNYVQEQLLLRLVRPHDNLCVVGDEDQALYRFRGATVRNILEFPRHFRQCPTVTLSANYRSHPDIVDAYDRWMASWDWSGPTGGTSFRYDKRIVPAPGATFQSYPAVLSIWGDGATDEARRFADLVSFLKDNEVIEDLSQVALLLHSVRGEHSGPYLEALAGKGIPCFCPRARAYFENDEIRAMVACFAVLLGYHGEKRGQLQGPVLQELADYVDDSIVGLWRHCQRPGHPLPQLLQTFVAEIDALSGDATLDRRLSDYLYAFLAHEPFLTALRSESCARNLAVFSQLLAVFQNYYHYAVITARNKEPIRFHFFNSFLRLLHDGGINEYEDPDQPFPPGHVQVMTIHQAKGLEFPVVAVGSLAAQTRTQKDVDRHLGDYYARPPFEPESRITGFDRMRLHYVAFSRAEKLLVLTSAAAPRPHFRPIWQGLAQWPHVEAADLGQQRFPLRQRMTTKKSFSFTSDLKVYETCPRQYQFFRLYDFSPARSADFFFGSLVHQTIEDLHRWVLEGSQDHLDPARLRDLFDFNFRQLINRGIRPIGARQREEAFSQVANYVRENRADLRRVLETEVDVSLEKDGYILTGRIDLLLGGDGKLELLDFKSQPRPLLDDKRLATYYKQLCIYAHILEGRYGKRPERLLLYWTGEEKREDALMSFPYDPTQVGEAGLHFDQVVGDILRGDFSVTCCPEGRVCDECDLRLLCQADGTIRMGAPKRGK